MAQIKYRVNLSAAEYPLNPTNMGASVIVAGYDQNLSRYVDTNESRDLSIGIPQVYYAENVLPTKEGLASVTYRSVRQDLGTEHSRGRHPSQIYLDDGTKLPAVLTARQANGVYYSTFTTLRTDGSLSFNEITVTPMGRELILDTVLTSAFVQGESYLFVPPPVGFGLYLFNGSATNVRYTQVSFDGLDLSNIKGIVASNGYMIAYTKDSIAWSSTLELMPGRAVRDTAYGVGEFVRHPSVIFSGSFRYKCITAGTTAATAPIYPSTLGGTVTDGTAVFKAEALTVDFVPSLETGAGGGAVEDVRGEIVVCLPTISGFIVYTTQNIVVATYTNNAEYPYTFRALPNSAGIRHASCVTDAAELGWQYALTTSGLMQVASTGCKLIFPAVQAWLNGEEDWGLGPTGFFLQDPAYGNYRLAFVQNRYLCVSKGNSPYTNAVAAVYDTLTDRWGQLRIPHAFICDRATPVGGDDTNQGLPIVVELYGTTYTWKAHSGREDSDSDTPASVKSKLVLGRYRHARGQHIQLHEVDIGSCYGAVSQVTPLVTYEHSQETVRGAALHLRTVSPTYARHKYLCRVDGQDISLAVEGAFQLNSLELTFTSGGHR